MLTLRNFKVKLHQKWPNKKTKVFKYIKGAKKYEEKAICMQRRTLKSFNLKRQFYQLLKGAIKEWEFCVTSAGMRFVFM